jgi:hypothetical protein
MNTYAHTHTHTHRERRRRKRERERERERETLFQGFVVGKKKMNNVNNEGLKLPYYCTG